MRVCTWTRFWNVMESRRRVSSQGNEAMSHSLRRYASMEYGRKLMNQRSDIWLLYRILINVCEERNGKSKGQRQISHKRSKVNNREKKVRASYRNKDWPELPIDLCAWIAITAVGWNTYPEQPHLTPLFQGRLVIHSRQRALLDLQSNEIPFISDQMESKYYC